MVMRMILLLILAVLIVCLQGLCWINSIEVFFLSMLAVMITGVSGQLLSVVEAFGAPPVSQRAVRYRSVALCLFMASSGLLLTAALSDTFVGDRFRSEVFGWGGIGCFVMCVLCGIRYAVMNNKCKTIDQEWDMA